MLDFPGMKHPSGMLPKLQKCWLEIIVTNKFRKLITRLRTFCKINAK